MDNATWLCKYKREAEANEIVAGIHSLSLRFSFFVTTWHYPISVGLRIVPSLQASNAELSGYPCVRTAGRKHSSSDAKFATQIGRPMLMRLNLLLELSTHSENYLNWGDTRWVFEDSERAFGTECALKPLQQYLDLES